MARTQIRIERRKPPGEAIKVIRVNAAPGRRLRLVRSISAREAPLAYFDFRERRETARAVSSSHSILIWWPPRRWRAAERRTPSLPGIANTCERTRGGADGGACRR